jgi:hypothetical protein
MPVSKPPESYTLDSHSESEEAPLEDTGPSTNADLDCSTRDTSEPHPNYSGRITRFSSRFEPPKNKDSATWITASNNGIIIYIKNQRDAIWQYVY